MHLDTKEIDSQLEHGYLGIIDCADGQFRNNSSLDKDG